MVSHSQESRASAQISCMRRQMPEPQTFPFPHYSPRFYHRVWCHMVRNIPLAWLCPPLSAWHTPQPPLWQSSIKTRKGLAVEAQVGSRWNIPVLSSTVLVTNPKHSSSWTEFNSAPKAVHATWGKKNHCNRADFFLLCLRWSRKLKCGLTEEREESWCQSFYRVNRNTGQGEGVGKMRKITHRSFTTW